MTTALPAPNAAPKTRRVGHRGAAGATTVRPPRGHGPVDRWSSPARFAVVPSESASVGSAGGGSGGVGAEGGGSGGGGSGEVGAEGVGSEGAESEGAESEGAESEEVESDEVTASPPVD